MTDDQHPMMCSRRDLSPEASADTGSIICVSKHETLEDEASVNKTTTSSRFGEGIRMQFAFSSNKCAFAAANAS